MWLSRNHGSARALSYRHSVIRIFADTIKTRKRSSFGFRIECDKKLTEDSFIKADSTNCIKSENSFKVFLIGETSRDFITSALHYFLASALKQMKVLTVDQIKTSAFLKGLHCYSIAKILDWYIRLFFTLHYAVICSFEKLQREKTAV